MKHPPVSVEGRRSVILRLFSSCAWGFACALPSYLGGCAGFRGAPLTPSLGPVVVENPLLVPLSDGEFLWLQLVDTVDDYFSIAQEQRMRRIGNVLTEGRIDTLPRIGSTIFEPWRGDSTPGFERLHATLQTIRRQATARVVPSENGFFVEVVVLKELEDLERPEHSTIGNAARRHDSSMQGPRPSLLGQPTRLGWISQGRDTSLESEILLKLQARLAAPTP